ncbi:MAG: hypothetical protein ASARMPRED_000598 [Alectoria sarmentosa]|nr:MAG: hypothetical protein ASARMPRED_000598 [Alectoria sarmentosa]
MGIEKFSNVPLPKILKGTSVVRRRPLRCLIWTFVFILYVYYINRRPSVDLVSPKPTPLADIPTKIWQVFFNYTPIDAYSDSIQTWITKNQDYQYTLVSAAGANAFALKHYANRREILHPFLSLRVPVLRSDLLRYMLLETEGGVYSDLDTAALKPVGQWIPLTLRPSVRAVVGIIEYDRGGGGGEEAYPGMGGGSRLQFCRWTMAASRGHPLMSRVVADVVAALQALAIKNETTIAKLRPSDEEVVRLSGPVIWTRAVLKTLSEATGTEMTYRNFTGMKEPRVFGDVMVLPVNGFGTGQLHSGSMRAGSRDALVRHGWKGSRKHRWSN